jgi:hypothetical protein
VLSGEVGMSEVEAFDTADGKRPARQRANQIKKSLGTISDHVEKLPGLILSAWKHGDWRWLNYENGEAYVRGEFETDLIRLNKQLRRAVTAETWSHGLSTRAIAAVTGISQSTAARDARESNDSRARRAARRTAQIQPGPPPDLAEVVDAEIVDDATDADALVRVINEFINTTSGKDELVLFKLALADAIQRCVRKINGKAA